MLSTKSGDAYGSAQLAERQMLLRDARERATRVRPAETTEFRYGFVTISRKNGSLGDAIARELASRLGWHVYDREIVDHIAQNSHVRQTLVERMDERAQNLIHESVQRFLTMAEGPSFGAEEYHEALIRTLTYLAACKEAIIIGRGANFVLRERNGGLHLRIVASPEIRSQRLSRRWSVSPSEARQRMELLDLERRDFVRHHFRQEIDDFRFYDLVLNTDILSAGQVADSIEAIVRLPRGSASPCGAF